MKKSLQGKLKGYAALAGSMVAVSGGAQIVYVDINPDTILHDSTFYDLDFNNDAVVDLTFFTNLDTTQTPNIQGAYVSPQGGPTNAVESSIMQAYSYPIAYNVGDTIKASSPNWITYAVHSQQYLGSVIGASTYGNFRGQSDKYLGARFEIAGVDHYGWVRLGVNAAADTIIVKEYAYELQDSTDIIIGSQTSVQQYQNSNVIRVHSYDHSLFVHTAQPQDGGTISIYNMNGQLVREEEITAGEMTLNLANETTGMYVVHVLQGETSTTRKIYLK